MRRIATFLSPIALIILLFACKVFFWSSAFPFFSNVDEKAHFDLISKYGARHHYLSIPLPYSEPSIELITTYQSPEYLKSDEHKYDEFLNLIFAPNQEVAKQSLRAENNYQNNSPPLYYYIMGAAYTILGIDEQSSLSQLYFLRWISALMALACFSFFLYNVKAIYSEEVAMGSGLIFFAFPQPVWYFLNNDVLSPLLICTGILLLWRNSNKYWILSSFLMALAVWNKLSNLVFLPIPLLMHLTLNHTWKKRIIEVVKYGAVLACLTFPLFLLNFIKTGTWTANSEKLEVLNWTANSFQGIVHHPIWDFTRFGKYVQLSFLSFARGEVSWELSPITASWFDWLLTLIALLTSWFILRELKKHQTLSLIVISGFALGIAFLLYLTLAFDYSQAAFPNKEFPYFFSGRILVGLFPFLPLAIFMAIRNVSDRFNLPSIVLSLVISLILIVGQVFYPLGIFCSPYNLFWINL